MSSIRFVCAYAFVFFTTLIGLAIVIERQSGLNFVATSEQASRDLSEPELKALMGGQTGASWCKEDTGPCSWGFGTNCQQNCNGKTIGQTCDTQQTFAYYPDHCDANSGNETCEGNPPMTNVLCQRTYDCICLDNGQGGLSCYLVTGTLTCSFRALSTYCNYTPCP